MITFQDYITTEFMDWLDSMSIYYKKINDNLYLIYKSDYCIKIYDRIGHGYGVTINLSQNYNETIYDGDTCSAYWVFSYLGLTAKSKFNSRTIIEYEKNMPLLIVDLKNLIVAIENVKVEFWDNAIKWIDIQSKKEFDIKNYSAQHAGK